MYGIIGLNGFGVPTNHQRGFKSLDDALILGRVMMCDSETLAIEVTHEPTGEVVWSKVWDDGRWNDRLAGECRLPAYN
jgi:hypothetical protein